jgi:hypothetical protein
LTNHRIIKFKEGTGSTNGNFPKRCTHNVPSIRLVSQFYYGFCFFWTVCFEIFSPNSQSSTTSYTT